MCEKTGLWVPSEQGLCSCACHVYWLRKSFFMHKCSIMHKFLYFLEYWGVLVLITKDHVSSEVSLQNKNLSTVGLTWEVLLEGSV